jgi:hypothetical protein
LRFLGILRFAIGGCSRFIVCSYLSKRKKEKDLLLVVVLFAFLARGIKQTKQLGLDFLKF